MSGAQGFARNTRHAVIAAAAIAAMTSAFEAGARLHAQTPAAAPERRLSRVDRLEAWVAAAGQHTPGVRDAAVLEVNRWNAEELRGVWIDVST
jgi:hypothetical protein